jgi:hypothetical protein
MARPITVIDPLNVAWVIGALGGTDEQLAATLGLTRQVFRNISRQFYCWTEMLVEALVATVML